jgi:mono/diheme cytochrome c family protein
VGKFTISILLLSLLIGCVNKNQAVETKSKKEISGKKVFETYCWGCHHQTAVAFGPSFSEIASKRTTEEIQAMIADPAGVSKVLGYKRNAMPPFELKTNELEAITSFILSYKPKGK